MTKSPVVAAFLFLAAAQVHGAPDTALDDLWKEYRDLASTQDAHEKRRRHAIARALGEIRAEKSVDALLRILDDDHDIRTRVEALRSLGKVAGPREFRKAVIIAAGQPKTVLPLYVGEALARTKDPEVARWAAEDLLRHPDERIRLGAVEALGLLGTPEAREPLLKLHAKHADSRTQADLVYEVVRALGRIGGTGAREALLEAAASDRPHLRLAAAETILLHCRDEDAIGAMRRLLGDDDRLVPVFAARAVGAAAEESLVPDVAQLLASPRHRLRAAARASLVAIAGEDLGASAEAWLVWHKRKQNGEKGPEDRRTVAAAGDGGPLVGADSVLLMLDISASMTWPNWGPRLERGKQELTKVLCSLPETTRFNVMTVAGYNQEWQKELCEATPKNVERAIEWNEERKYVLYTNTIDGLMAALDHEPALDAAFWFSDDSLPVGGNYKEHEEILALVREANRLRKVELHTVSLLWGRGIERFRKHEDAEDFAEFMRLLAEESGGTFTEIRGPDTERYRRTRTAWGDKLPAPEDPGKEPAKGDARRKPLLVYVPSDLPSNDQDRLEEDVLEDESFALASRFFECVKVPEADARSHPLFDGLRWSPPAISVFDSSRSVREVLRGRPKAAKAIGLLRKVGQPDYDTDISDTLRKAKTLLGRFDEVDAARSALRLKRIRAKGAAGDKAGVALARECDSEEARLVDKLRQAEQEWNELFALKLKKMSP